MTLMIGFLFGTLGLGYSIYGKKQSEFDFLLFGVLLMGYSYFIPSPLLAFLVGGLLLAGPFIIRRFF